MKTCFNGSNSSGASEKVRKSRIIIISQLKKNGILQHRERLLREKCKAKKEEIEGKKEYIDRKSGVFYPVFQVLEKCSHATALISIIFHLQNTQRRQRARECSLTTLENGQTHLATAACIYCKCKKKGNIKIKTVKVIRRYFCYLLIHDFSN